LVLIDGYRRVAAPSLSGGRMGVLARTQGRCFAAIEEAPLLRELTQGLGVSQREAARRCARDGSWVNRRLQLLASLPEAALAAVREGRLSSWAAARMIASLARANSGHPDRLLRAQGQARLSTRELRQWFEHYQKARRGVRERMVEHPRLFLQALNEPAEQKSSERLRDGPEGRPSPSRLSSRPTRSARVSSRGWKDPEAI
jgi:hypothetical protein